MSHQYDRVSPESWVDETSTAEDLRGLMRFLTERGTFQFPSLSNGLFSASAGGSEDITVTGYHSIWLRDNMHIAWAHWMVLNDAGPARRCVQTLFDFYVRHQHRFTQIIEGKADFNEPMNRPHVRFSGENLSELPEKWSHAQNDALGYFLWLVSRLMLHQQLVLTPAQWEIVADLIHFWRVIRFWQDEDSGHWEESRKISASSIGVATAGLTLLRRLMDRSHVQQHLSGVRHPVTAADVQELIERGQQALSEILPFECIQTDPAKGRRYDAALLFLIYPLNVIDRSAAEMILSNVRGNLLGPIGIRRYQGDSYWCADYKKLLDASTRTADFSDNMEARDALLKPGMEAQWCIFDPIISCLYGVWYLQEYAESDRQQQIVHLRRSLSQLTSVDNRFGAYRCPESYYCESGQWTPNDITPLLWTQANLWQALKLMERTLL